MLTVFTTTNCAYCPRVLKYLDLHKKPYKTVNVDDDYDTRLFLQKKTGLATVPVTTDGITYVSGWNVKKLKELITS